MRCERADLHTLAGAYVLNAVSTADRARFERHLASCPACEQETAGLRELTARLACAAAEPPPPELISRAVALAGRTRQLPPRAAAGPVRPWYVARACTAARRARPRLRLAPLRPGPLRPGPLRPGPLRQGPLRQGPLRLAIGMAAVFLTAAMALGLVARHAERQASAAGQRSQQIATVLTAPDAVMLGARAQTGGTATVVMSHRDAALVFTTAGLRRLPSSRCYQLWLMGPAGDRAAGMLPAPRDGMTGPVVVSGLRPGDHIGLTVEPDGGTPQPTSVPILMVTL
jgi:anti-sigma-K factor RskA